MKTLQALITAMVAPLNLAIAINGALYATASPVSARSTNPAIVAPTRSLASGEPLSVLVCLTQPESILAFWPAERNFNDITNCNTGTRRGGVSFDTGGVGNAFVFNGTDAVIEIGTALNMGLSVFTLEAWIKGDTSMESWGQIFDKGLPPHFASAGCRPATK